MTLGSGYTNLRNKDLLIKTQDEVWASGKFLPKPGKETTFCNLAVQAVLHPMGCHLLDGKTADQMMEFLRSSKDFLRKPLQDCQFLVNEGSLILAGLTAQELGQGHGHIVTLTPGAEDYSGHWDKKVPVCMNLGREGTCFRSKGVNWAFQKMPDFYAWKETL